MALGPDSRHGGDPGRVVRFGRSIQLTRAGTYAAGFVIVLGLRKAGVLSFSVRESVAYTVVAISSALLFYALYDVARVRPLFTIDPLSLLTDLALVTYGVVATGGFESPCYLGYLAVSSTAAFVLGRRAALWVSATAVLSYLSGLLLAREVGFVDAAFLVALGRMVFLYGMAFFFLKGIADLQEKRLVIRQLRDEAEARTVELRNAQEQILKLQSPAAGMLEDTAAWAATIAQEVARAVGAREIGVWAVKDGGLQAVAPGGTRPPASDLLSVPGGGLTVSADPDVAVAPALGLSGEPRGVLVIDGPGVRWGEAERRIVQSFAHHLGTALELRQIRDQLTSSEAQRGRSRRELHERGIATLEVCPACTRCFAGTTERAGTSETSRCPEDGTPLSFERLLPHRVQARYRLDRLLGEGGMGTVFAAHDERLTRDVALKIIRAEHLNDSAMRFRLAREAQAIARIRHPAVIALFDSGELEDGSAFLVMELLEGRDVGRLLEAHGPGSPAQVAELLRQAAGALAAAHRADVVHRDVKPANLFVSTDGTSRPGSGMTVKVLDFGLARSISAETRLTMTGMVLGTPAYMSPEQVLGEECGPASDLYSLAASAYEALTGRPPIAAQGPVGQLMVEVLFSPPPPVSTLLPTATAELDAAFAGALCKRPVERPPSLEVWADSTAALLRRLPRGEAAWPI